MKNNLVLMLCCLSIRLVWGQTLPWSPAGDWNGTLEVQGMRLPVVFHIQTQNGGYTATMDSPLQDAYGLAIDQVTVSDTGIYLEIRAARASYSGTLQPDGSIVGTWSQAGTQLPLTLHSGTYVLKRPQEPQPPFYYHSEEVVIENKKTGVRLAGTLSYPYNEGGRFPAVVLISGSGAQDRNEEILGHKPFLVIADYLVQQNYAVLRFDDRGFGKSTGNHAAATTADFADDVEAVFEFLRRHEAIIPSKIGLIGHSEGGMIASIVAARQKKVAFVILLAAPGQPLKDLLLQQARDIGRASGISTAHLDRSAEVSRTIFEAVAADKKGELTLPKLMERLQPKLSSFTEEERAALNITDQFLMQQLAMVLTPWMRYALAFDPAPYLAKVRCPVLALNGEKDLQVHPSNLMLIEDILKKSKNRGYQVKRLSELNHLFQHCRTGLPSEYGDIEETFAPEALDLMYNWLNEVLWGN